MQAPNSKKSRVSKASAGPVDVDSGLPSSGQVVQSKQAGPDDHQSDQEVKEFASEDEQIYQAFDVSFSSFSSDDQLQPSADLFANWPDDDTVDPPVDDVLFGRSRMTSTSDKNVKKKSKKSKKKNHLAAAAGDASSDDESSSGDFDSPTHDLNVRDHEF